MKILISLLLLTAICSYQVKAFSPLPPEKPTLVINIILDNVSSHDIERHASLLNTKGLLKIKNEGSTFSNIYFPYTVSDKVCDYASLMTGSCPAKHSIIGQQWYEPNSEKYKNCTFSKNAILIGNDNQEHSGDASSLLASTLPDELKLNTKSVAKTYAVSLHQDAAILLAGHAANGAFWLDDQSGNWVSSDYYMAWLPDWIKDFNNKCMADFYISQEWVLSYNPKDYNSNLLAYNEKTFPLKIEDYQDDKAPYKILKSTPLGNMFITDFTTQLIKEEKLGKDSITDFLTINYSDIENKNIKNDPLSIEKADFLVKLDHEIEKLLEVLNTEVGNQNYLISLTSTQVQNYSSEYLEQHHIIHGSFDPEKAVALLNSYLMALYGQGKWVLNYSNSQIYLNNALIKKSRINSKEFQEIIANFMEEFSGVAWAIPAYHLKYSSSNSEIVKAMKSSFYPDKSGDIMIALAPGWIEKDKKTCNGNFRIPLYFYGWKIERNSSEQAISFTNICSTWASLLGVPTPNATSNKLILDILLNKK